MMAYIWKGNEKIVFSDYEGIPFTPLIKQIERTFAEKSSG